MDWSPIMLDLRRHFGTYERISAACGHGPRWAYDIAEGLYADVKFNDGMQILRLAFAHLPQERIKALGIEAEIQKLIDYIQPQRPRNPVETLTGIMGRQGEARA